MVNWFRRSALTTENLTQLLDMGKTDPARFDPANILGVAKDLVDNKDFLFNDPRSGKKTVPLHVLQDFWRQWKALYEERGGDASSFPEIEPPTQYTVGPD